MLWTILKLMLSSWTSIKRWNNFPRIEDLSHLDNVGFTLHIALFLAYLEEKNGNKIDKSFLIKKILFRSLTPLIISDVNWWTKKYIKDVDKDIFIKLEKKVYDNLFLLDSPDYLKDDIKKVIENNDKNFELLIIKASRRYASFKECETNSKIYIEIYEVPYNWLLKDINEIRKKLSSFDELLSNKNYEKFILNIRRLSHNMRWNKQKRILPISVMSHIVLVTFLAYIVWFIENKNWWNFDILEMMLIWAHHDISEAIVWDIITPPIKGK